MTMQPVLDDTSVIGRDLQLREGTNVTRGPIKSVCSVDGEVTFSLGWMALKGLRGGWQRHPGNSLTIFASTTAKKNDDGCWEFHVAYVGGYTILADGDNLDPSRVEGLEDPKDNRVPDAHVTGGITPENMDRVDKATLGIAESVADGSMAVRPYDDADFPDG